jgi:hypothetical protein
MSRRAHPPALLVEQLEDRLNPSGSVVPAGEFNWTQYSPTGELGQLVWNGGTLVYRARVAGGWQETAVASSGSFTAGQYNSTDEVQKASQTAQLVFTSDGTPHALFLEKQWTGSQYRTLIQHYARTSGGWQRIETVVPPAASNWGPNNLIAEAGANNSIHLIYTDTNTAATGVGNFGAGTLWYANNAGGAWGYNKVADTADLSQDVWFTGGRWAPRFLSLAVDAQGAAHVTYTPQFYIAGAFSTVQSTLTYATNTGDGTWRSQAVYGPQDGTADAGLGASVAVSPSGQVAIASYYVDRYNTGSPQSSKLMYHTLSGGTWSSATVASAPDGYAAGDGAKFTGFAPQLYFDAAGRANIVFSDEAGEHLPVTYANEYAGQIRLATQSGSSWSLQTVYRQSDPLRNQLFYPVAATYNGQTTFSGLQAVSTLDGNKNPTRTDYAVVDVAAPYGASAPPVSVAPPVTPGPVPAPPATGETGTTTTVAAASRDAAPPAGITSGWAVALDSGAYASQVFVFRTDGSLQMTVTPYGTGHRGGVRFARADVNGDGIADLITVPKQGIEARVRVWDGQSGAMIGDFAPFAGYTGGLYVAAGDIDGDGRADIAVGLDQFPMPYVSVYNGNGYGQMTAFMAYGFNLAGGVQVAMGDVNGDGYADIVTSPGAAVPLVSVFDGRSIATGGSGGPTKFSEFMFYPLEYRIGVNISAGDVDGDGYADVLGGAGSAIAHVRAVSGRALSDGTGLVDLVNTVTSDGATPGGSRIAAVDADGDGRTDLVTTAGSGNGGRVSMYAAPAADSATSLRYYDPLPGLASGMYVG